MSSYENLPVQIHFRIFEFLSLKDLINLSSISAESYNLIIPNLYNKVVLLPFAKSNLIKSKFENTLDSVKVINNDNISCFLKTLSLNKYNKYIREMDFSLLNSTKLSKFELEFFKECVENCDNLKILRFPKELSFLNSKAVNLSINRSVNGVLERQISEVTIDLDDFNESFISHNIKSLTNIEKLQIILNEKNLVLENYENLYKLIKIFNENNILLNLTELSFPLLGGGISILNFQEDLITDIFNVIDLSKLIKLQLTFIEPSINLFQIDIDDDLTQETVLFDLSSMIMELESQFKSASKLNDLSIKYHLVNHNEEDFMYNNNNVRIMSIVQLIVSNALINGLYLFLDFPNLNAFQLNLLEESFESERLKQFSITVSDLDNIFPSNDIENQFDDDEDALIDDEHDLDPLFEFDLHNLFQGFEKEVTDIELKYNLNYIIIRELNALQNSVKYLIEDYKGFNLWNYPKLPKILVDREVDDHNGYIVDFVLKSKLSSSRINEKINKISIFGLDYIRIGDGFNLDFFNRQENSINKFFNEIKSISNSIHNNNETENVYNGEKRSVSFCYNDDSLYSIEKINLINFRRNSSYQSNDLSIRLSS